MYEAPRAGMKVETPGSAAKKTHAQNARKLIPMHSR